MRSCGPIPITTFPMHRVRAIATSRVAVNCALLTSVQRTGKAVVPTQSNFAAPQRELHSMSGMAQGPSAVSAGGGGGNDRQFMDTSTRLSLENEDEVSNALAIPLTVLFFFWHAACSKETRCRGRCFCSPIGM